MNRDTAIEVMVEGYRRAIDKGDRPENWQPRPDHAMAMAAAYDALLRTTAFPTRKVVTASRMVQMGSHIAVVPDLYWHGGAILEPDPPTTVTPAKAGAQLEKDQA